MDKKDDKKNGNIIALDGGKRRAKRETEAASPEDTSVAKIEVDGQSVELGAFILAGETPDGKRMLLTWGCSPDEMTAYVKTLDIVVTKKIEEILGMRDEQLIDMKEVDRLIKKRLEKMVKNHPLFNDQEALLDAIIEEALRRIVEVETALSEGEVMLVEEKEHDPQLMERAVSAIDEQLSILEGTNG